MPAQPTPRRAAAELARRLANVAQQQQRPGGAVQALDGDRFRQLLSAVAADPEALDGLLPALARELRTRGLQMPALQNIALPAEMQPLLATLDAAFAPGAGDAELDAEALARELDAQLQGLLGASPSQTRARLFSERARQRAGDKIAASMRRHGLVPERDQPAQDDGYWSLLDSARSDRAGFLRRLSTLPRERLALFYWEHQAALREPQAAPPDTDPGADALSVFRQRFGEPLAPGL